MLKIALVFLTNFLALLNCQLNFPGADNSDDISESKSAGKDISDRNSILVFKAQFV